MDHFCTRNPLERGGEKDRNVIITIIDIETPRTAAAEGILARGGFHSLCIFSPVWCAFQWSSEPVGFPLLRFRTAGWDRVTGSRP